MYIAEHHNPTTKFVSERPIKAGMDRRGEGTPERGGGGVCTWPAPPSSGQFGWIFKPGRTQPSSVQIQHFISQQEGEMETILKKDDLWDPIFRLIQVVLVTIINIVQSC